MAPLLQEAIAVAVVVAVVAVNGVRWWRARRRPRTGCDGCGLADAHRPPLGDRRRPGG